MEPARVPAKSVRDYVLTSYELVKAKLPKKVQKELDAQRKTAP
jgi:predicted DNA-binding protein (MmcQ/YjbR family)